jgi:pyruvate/2-oxoglutarate dehydrogenase complex dihydrolipoamide acyltransferase (E2) component
MKTKFVMPSLAKDMTAGLIVEWHKKPGDALVSGEVLLEVETDKVNVELEAPFDGILVSIEAAEGEKAPVGSVIAWLERN